MRWYNTNGLSQGSISINDGTADIKPYIMMDNMGQNTFYSCLRIERGTTATPYSLAPEAILNFIDPRSAQSKNTLVILGCWILSRETKLSGLTSVEIVKSTHKLELSK